MLSYYERFELKMLASIAEICWRSFSKKRKELQKLTDAGVDLASEKMTKENDRAIFYLNAYNGLCRIYSAHHSMHAS